jgi:carboxymethylenebutenolidase
MVGGGAADRGELVLRASDGNRLAAHFARAANPSGTGMVVLPDAGGLSDFYRALADRFAEAGIDSVAIDYYGRTAGLGPRPAGFKADDHMDMTRPETVDADVAAAAEDLRSKEGGAVRKLFSVGFCFGGAVSWRQASHGFDGVIGFYGSGAALRATVPELKSLEAPILLLVAEEDPYFPLEDSKQIDRELEAAGVDHRMVIYKGVPHGFFSGGEWKEACDDAWGQVLQFVNQSSEA